MDTSHTHTWFYNQISLCVRDIAVSVPRQMGRLLTSCLRSASLPAESAAVSTSRRRRQSDAGQRMIRCCLTCAQYGTCVYSVGMITGLGHPPTRCSSRGIGVVQRCVYLRGRSAVGPFFSGSVSHVRALCSRQPALASTHIKVVSPFLCFWLMWTRRSPRRFYGVLLSC